MMEAQNCSPADDPANAPLQRESNPRPRILVAEDDAAIRELNTGVLTCSGYHVDAAEDGAAAWEALQKNNYDLLVTDHDMPKVTGVELIQKIQAARMALPVIMATGTFPNEEINRNGLRPPALTLIKPYTFKELLTAVKKVLLTTSTTLEDKTSISNWQVLSPPDPNP